MDAPAHRIEARHHGRNLVAGPDDILRPRRCPGSKLIQGDEALDALHNAGQDTSRKEVGDCGCDDVAGVVLAEERLRRVGLGSARAELYKLAWYCQLADDSLDLVIFGNNLVGINVTVEGGLAAANTGAHIVAQANEHAIGLQLFDNGFHGLSNGMCARLCITQRMLAPGASLPAGEWRGEVKFIMALP